jgi:hypothetical protein
VCNKDTQYQNNVVGARNDHECAELTDCKSQQWVSKLPTPTTDRECTNHTICAAHTQYQTKAAGLDHDRECTDLTVCGGDEWISKAHTATSDRACAGHTLCSGNEWQSTAASQTNDRVCQSLTTCGDRQYESKAATATSDRECRMICSLIGTDRVIWDQNPDLGVVEGAAIDHAHCQAACLKIGCLIYTVSDFRGYCEMWSEASGHETSDLVSYEGYDSYMCVTGRNNDDNADGTAARP